MQCYKTVTCHTCSLSCTCLFALDGKLLKGRDLPWLFCIIQICILPCSSTWVKILQVFCLMNGQTSERGKKLAGILNRQVMLACSVWRKRSGVEKAGGQYEIWSEKTWMQISARLPTNCVPLNKSGQFSIPNSPLHKRNKRQSQQVFAKCLLWPGLGLGHQQGMESFVNCG